MGRRTSFALLLVVGLLVGALGWPPGARGATGRALSAPRRIWVVTANVREQGRHDARRHVDMRRFIRATDTFVRKEAPDVVALQQVNRRSAKWLRKAFSKKTEHRFTLAVGPRQPGRGGDVRTEIESDHGRRLLRRDDTAILINTAAIRVLSKGKTHVTQPTGVGKRLPMRQMVPWAKIREKRTGLKMTVTSIHYPTHAAFKTRRKSEEFKARSSARLTRLLDRKMHDTGPGDNRIPVLAGDFNATKCKPGTSDHEGTCRKSMFWQRMKRLSYDEALHIGEYGTRRNRMIDFIFTKGYVSDVYWDTNAQKASSGCCSFYSDHGVATALLEDKDTTPPYPLEELLFERFPDGHPHLFAWDDNDVTGYERDGGWDGGPGEKHWLVYRRPDGEENWERIARLEDHPRFETGDRYTDTDIDLREGGTFYYQVRAEDGSGNLSRPTLKAHACMSC